MNNYYVGIDFGTTNSSLALLNPLTGQVEVKRIDVGEQPLLIRTIVSKTMEGEWIIGNQAAALDQLRQRSVFSLKTELRKNPHFKLLLDEEEYSVEDLFMIFLRELLVKAGIHHPETIERLCLSVPVQFDENGKSIMENAAVRLGIPKHRIWFLNEPVSILWDCRNIQGQYLLVFDFGGGTLDLAVMDKYETEDRLEEALQHADSPLEPASRHVHGTVLAKQGLELGGDDLDDVVIRYFIEQGKLQENPVCESISLELFDDAERLFKLKNHPKFAFYYHLKNTAEKAKQALSHQEQVTLSIPPLLPGVDQGIKDITLSLEQFIVRTEPIRNQMLQGLKRLNDQFHQSTGLSRNDIKAVLLSGGSSLLSFVPDLLEELYPEARIVWDEEHLQTRIARGNARYTNNGEEMLVGDTINAAYGIYNHAGKETVVMIERSERYPIQKVKRVATTKPNQRVIEIAPMVKYADSRDFEPLKKNGRAVKWRMNIRPHPQTLDLSRIAVTYAIDKSQRMHISAYDNLFESEIGIEEISLTDL